jgi:hypothetical protein
VGWACVAHLSFCFGKTLYPNFHRTWQPQAILLSDWSIFLNSSPLKPLGQMNRNWVGSIYGRSSITIIRNKNCLWWPCLLMDQDEICNLYREPFIDASYQVSAHLANWFSRRRLKYEKLTDDKRRPPSDGKSSYCLWQGKLLIMEVCIAKSLTNMATTGNSCFWLVGF